MREPFSWIRGLASVERVEVKEDEEEGGEG
jgi:hypothetical protein